MANIISSDDKKKLDKMIEENNVEDNTNDIQIKKHSDLIRNDIKTFIFLKDKYKRLSQTNPKEFEAICNKNCNFIFSNYTNIYNKLLKNTLNLEIMDKFLITLKNIELGKINQHEGSYIIGNYLKQIYIDSALTEEKNRNKNQKKHKKVEKKPSDIINKDIDYKTFKLMNIEK
tara:strand:- start:1466 stop:1984 length:519 start_codon:yes stop_codon:yes gene_type:complete